MWELKRSKGGLREFYYVNEEEKKISPPLETAREFIDGNARVELVEDKKALYAKKIYGEHQYRFLNNNGEISQIYYDAMEYSQGYAAVKVDENSDWQFRDASGKLSDETYFRVFDNCTYNVPFLVRKNENSLYQYFYNGKLSEEFKDATVYSGLGLAGVLLDDGLWHFRDENGKISEDGYVNIDTSFGYWSPEKYKYLHWNEGQCRVQPTIYKSKIFWRDLLGNLTKKMSQVGKDYFYYKRGDLDVYGLSDECFGDDKFLNEIMKNERSMFMQAVEQCKTEDDLKQLAEVSAEISEYIKAKAYEAYQKKSSEILEDSQQDENEKSEVTADDKLDEKKDELKEKLSKMF